MKLLLTTLLALFPLLHETKYQVSLESCSSDGILVRMEEEVKTITLFNVSMNEAGIKRVCNRLEKANQIMIEVDASTKIEEPLSVYIFADGRLLQEEVLENKEGTIKIRNPEYRYEQAMEKAESIQATIGPSKEKDKHKVYPKSYGYRYLWAFIGIWLLLAYMLFSPHLKSKKKRVHYKGEKTSENE